MREIYIASYFLIAISFIRKIRRKFIGCSRVDAGEYVLLLHDDAASLPILLLRSKSMLKLIRALKYMQSQGFLTDMPSNNPECTVMEAATIEKYDEYIHYANFRLAKAIFSEVYFNSLEALLRDAEGMINSIL